MIFIYLKYKTCLLVLLICLFSTDIILGQIEYSGYPAGVNQINRSQINYFQLPSAEELRNQNAKKEQTEERPYKRDNFASPVAVELSPLNHGTWSTGENNQKIWQLGITSNFASSLSLIFDRYNLSPGCRLFVYSPDMKELYGAFTFRNNKESKVLAISPVQNDSLIIELQVENNVKDFGELALLKIGVGFPGENIFKNTADEYFGWSAYCQVDVNCELDEYVQRQKYSVCRIIFDASTRCTGTLINNTDEDGRPLILTSGHCILSPRDAETAMYFFDYESPYCNGPDGKTNSVSGSTLLSRGYELDFSLMEMSEKPPADYYPLYAGWDAQEEEFDSVYIIHHPEGDVKKIATANDNLLTGSFPPYDADTHWFIEKYDTGTTEAGSSGAALFNSSNRVVGTLTGGDVPCSEEINDFYQMLSHQDC